MPDQNWQFELEEYIKQGEPDRAEKSEAWQTAIGLQAVDGLNTSAYLLDTAKDHIEGKITIDEAQQRIHSYYEQRTTRTEIENETKEADIVSARIAKLLGEKTFQFSPAEWITIHRRLFEGVFDHAGQIRKYNISKKEWILNGETVIYADFNSIKDTLDYDFATEKQFSYEGLSVEASVKHLAKFASDIWQIHPFGEGNTRATAVFMIKYMKTFGFRVNNDAFRENSWYFRNALVRANYVVDKMIADNGFAMLKKQLAELLYSTNPIEKRWDVFLKSIKGMGPATISELLTYANPQEYVIFNKTTILCYGYLDIPDMPKYNYQYTGKKYAEVCAIAKKIAAELKKAGADDYDLLAVDYFMWDEILPLAEKKSPVSPATPEVKKPVTVKDSKSLHDEPWHK